MRHRTASALALLPAVCLALAAGCSADRQIVRSSTHAPRSVAVVDTVARQAIWSMDIPPGHTVVFNADNAHDLPAMRQANSPATSMAWRLYRTAGVETAFIDSNHYLFKCPIDRGTIQLTGNPILIDVTLNQPTTPTLAPALQTPAAPAEAPQVAPAPAVEQQMEDAADAAEPLPIETK